MTFQEIRKLTDLKNKIMNKEATASKIMRKGTSF